MIITTVTNKDYYKARREDPVGRNKTSELCLDQLAYVLKLNAGRKPCIYGGKCMRDHDFRSPISSRVKDAARELLKSDKYGKDAIVTKQKFKADMLKAMG